MTSRSPKLDDIAARYDELFTRASRTAEEETELKTLRERLATSYLDGETAAQRNREAADSAELDKPLRAPTGRPSRAQQAELRRVASMLDAIDADEPPGADS
jgi:hypothetical protein